jgi:hypothetical protein
VGVLALLGGLTLQAMPRAVLSIATASPAMMMIESCPADECSLFDHPAGRAIPADSVKQADSDDIPNLQHAPVVSRPLAYHTIDYWFALLRLSGLSHKPDLFPPIGVSPPGARVLSWNA